MSDNNSETIEPETKENFEIIIDDDKISIEIDYKQITFHLIVNFSFYRYVKNSTYCDILKELELDQKKYGDSEELLNYFRNSKYKVIKDDNKIMRNNKVIQLEEKMITDHEFLLLLIDQLKEMKEQNNKAINELIKKNKQKDFTINELESKCNDLESKYNELEKKLNNIGNEKVIKKNIKESVVEYKEINVI